MYDLKNRQRKEKIEELEKQIAEQSVNRDKAINNEGALQIHDRIKKNRKRIK